MAKNLQERLASARETDRVTIETLAKLIEDARAERERLTAAHERASADSIDFALAEDDREEAAANAGRYARSLAALASAIEELEAKLDAKRNSDAQRGKAAEKASAIAERDEIAARFAERVPVLTAELIELFKAVEANEARMRAAGIFEANAEWKARGFAGNGLVGGISPAMPFTKLKIPDFTGAGRAWPAETANAISGAIANNCAEQIRRGREDDARAEQEKADAAAKFAAEHGTYQIEVEYSIEHGDTVAHVPEELIGGNLPAAMGPWDVKQLVLPHTVAEKLGAAPRFKVTRLDGGHQ
ncbi:MAG: hypothetical protein V2I27_09385 [Erythrobacter sp.]|jgi:1,6-anhydro-N-acetylmuramate kinase|nr:hypothetical protein [Erythrobacter sp.]